MKTRWLWIVGGLVFLLTALLHAPAAFVYGRLKPRLPNIELFGVEGTITHGSITGFAMNGRPQAQALQWQIKPLWLALGSLAAHIEGSGALEFDTNLRAGFGGQLSLSNLHVHGPIEALTALAHIPLTPVNGGIDVDMKSLALAHGKPTGADGAIEVQNLVWKFAPSPVPLGDFRAVTSNDGGAIVAKITSIKGPLDADGSLRLDSSAGSYNLDLKLRPKPDAPPSLTDLLQQLGPADPQNFHHLRQQGSLPQ